MANHLHPKYKWGWRTKNRRLQKYVTINLEDSVYGTPQEFFDRINAAIEQARLTDAEVTMETEYGSYGTDDRQVFAVKGWRDATAEEKAKAEADYDQAQRQIAERQQADLDAAERALREARPDLFTK